MAFIKFNRKEAEAKANQFGAIEEGDYELYVVEGEWRPMLDKPDKTPNFNLKLKIRSDVGQAAAGRTLFHSFFISRDPEKAATSMDFIDRFNVALGLPDGVEFETEEQWISYITGKPVKAHVIQREYNGKTNPAIQYFMETEHPEMTEQDKPSSGMKPASTQQQSKVDDDPFANNNGTIDINDEDLPF